MNREQIDFIKHCGEHFEVLSGGRGHSKTKKIIEELQQENQQLKIQLLEKKCSDKDIEYKEKIKLQKRIDKALGHLNLFIWEEQLSKYDTLKILTHTRDILKGENNE